MLHIGLSRVAWSGYDTRFESANPGDNTDFLVQKERLLSYKPTGVCDRLGNGLLNPCKLAQAQKLPVQASMACLLPDSGKETLPRDCFSSAAGLLQSALRAKLGLPQPRLLELMQVCQYLFCLHV